MPIKLTSKDYRIISAVVVVAGISLAIGVKYFWRAFPEAAIEFRVTRDDSEPVARRFLADRGLQVTGYRHAAAFEFDDEAKVYLERTQGLERMNGLTQGPVRLWRWEHRWFRPEQKEEFRVDVTPAGEVVALGHEVEEKAPGADLDPARAEAIAKDFLRNVMKRDLNDLEFVVASSAKRPNRTDHSFTWKQKSVNLGDGSWRIEVDVAGDRVSGYNEFVKVPDQWKRDYAKLRSRNDSAQTVDQLLFFGVGLAMLVILVQRLRDRDIPIRAALAFGLVGTVLYFLGQLNDYSFALFGYRTTDPYSSFVAAYIMESAFSALAVGVFIALLVASAEPVYREAYPRLPSIVRTLSWNGLRSKSFFIANVVGIGLTFFFFAYQTVFYLAANRLGAWAPAEVKYSDLLNTRIPWVWVLFIGFLPAVFEELMFRAFAIPFLKKLLKSLPLALVLAAFIWGFGHAGYPNQPFYIRGVEVGVAGIVIGVMMLRFGVVATMIWHYSVDALYTAFLLLRSHNTYLTVSGGVTAGIMLVPLAVAAIAYLRTGTFADEETLTNASAGVSRVPPEAPAAEPEGPLAYRPLTRPRLVLAVVLIVACLSASAVKVYHFGEGIRVQTARRDAFRVSEEFLKARHIDPASYHRVAALDENVDPQAVRYLLERRSVEETDRIYRQATRLLLWEVRYFRPLEKEEHHVYVDAAQGQVFGYQRVLDEDAPGASLSMDQARAVAEKAVEEHGYHVVDFVLKESHGPEKKKARQDYFFVWEAKPGDPRNVGEATYRLRVDIAGDQVVGFARFFKLPDDWLRRREATALSRIILGLVDAALLVAVVGAIIIVFVSRVRSGAMPWRPALRAGAALAVIFLGVELNALPLIYFSRYDTSIPMAAFHLFVGASLVIVAVVLGLATWVLVALATSLYPDSWRIFSAPARRMWRRDAVVAILVSLAAGVALGEIQDLLADRFHAFMPVGISIVPASIDTLLPAAGVLLTGLLDGLVYSAGAALLIFVICRGFAQRAWWLGPVGLLFLISMGPVGATSVRQFLLSWGTGFLTAVAAICILAFYFRDNVLAYVGAAFLAPILSPLFSLLSQPAAFFLWNGVALALLTLAVMAWLFALGRGAPVVVQPPPTVGFPMDSSPGLPPSAEAGPSENGESGAGNRE